MALNTQQSCLWLGVSFQHKYFAGQFVQKQTVLLVKMENAGGYNDGCSVSMDAKGADFLSLLRW